VSAPGDGRIEIRDTKGENGVITQELARLVHLFSRARRFGTSKVTGPSLVSRYQIGSLFYASRGAGQQTRAIHGVMSQATLGDQKQGGNPRRRGGGKFFLETFLGIMISRRMGAGTP